MLDVIIGTRAVHAPHSISIIDVHVGESEREMEGDIGVCAVVIYCRTVHQSHNHTTPTVCTRTRADGKWRGRRNAGENRQMAVELPVAIANVQSNLWPASFERCIICIQASGAQTAPHDRTPIDLRYLTL